MSRDLSNFKELRDQSHKIHGAFLEALKYRHEQKEGHALNATAWFMILTQGPTYSWFRPFTQLITDMDILLDEVEMQNDSSINSILERLEKLFSTVDSKNEFAHQFMAMLPNETDLMLNYHSFKEAHKKVKTQV